MPDEEVAKRLEEEIAELERRWPAHSAPPGMWTELERLENELDEARRRAGEEHHDREDGAGRLPRV